MKTTLKLMLGLLIAGLAAGNLFAQDNGMKISVEPETLNMDVGETRQIAVTVTDSAGANITADLRIRFYAIGSSRMLETDTLGNITAYRPGEGRVAAIAFKPTGGYLRQDVTVNVAYPPLASVEIIGMPETIYENTTIPVSTVVMDQKDLLREGAEITWASSNEKIAEVDGFGNLIFNKKGKVKITATADGSVSSTVEVNVRKNPVDRLELTADMKEARTGDVFHLSAKAYDKKGREVTNAPIFYSFQAHITEYAPGGAGLIEQDGRFVAEKPGLYTLQVSSGTHTDRMTVKVVQRDVRQKLVALGQGRVSDVHTSDLWVWEGVDGRDYAVTGTWGANGDALFWDVTDATNIHVIDSVRVDARTVNDVKVSEDGRICVISREGASNRKNGLYILDVSNPRDVKVITQYDEGLTGGVHNVFIYENHIYALSAGRRYDILNIEDPANPVKVASHELLTPNHSIHDVWVDNGIAISSNWKDGVQLVDVGNGIKEGTPSNPVTISSFAYPSGWNHAAFPFTSPETNKFYVIAGDEAFPNGANVSGQVSVPAGYMHFIDFSDLDNPREVARYEVPGAGTHNFWVEGNLLYIAYYNGGLRVVDISGDLMGDLYRQGREVAWFLPGDPEGKIANQPMAWGAQPYKGKIFVSDMNSGLWAFELQPVTAN